MTDFVSEELDYKGKPIRAIKADGALWFAARDIVAALGGTYGDLYAAAKDPCVPECCRSTGLEVPCPDIPGEPDGAVVLLSSLGVWYWTHATNPGGGQSIAAWAKREAGRLVPEAAKDDPRSFLTVGPKGEMPPYPLKFSGRKSEWIALNDSGLSFKRKHGLPE